MRSLALLLAVAMPVSAAIDLSPTASVRELEGVKFPELIFRDGADTVSYEPPSGWSYRGNANILTLTPAHKNEAQASIQVLASSRGAPQLTPARLAELKQVAIDLVPKDAGSVKVIAEEQNPLKIDGRDTFGVTLAYTFYGQSFQSYILFCDLETSQLRFRLVCASRDHSELAKLFQSSLCSLQWIRRRAH
jgi:hypothetical protein